MIIFDVSNKDILKNKLTLVLISDRLWRKCCLAFDLYKNGSSACFLKSIQHDDFVHNKTKQYGSIFFRPLHNMDEIELHETTGKIIQGSIWLSTNIENNVNAKTLAQYCKRAKHERTSKKLICEYLKVKDNTFYNFSQVSERNVIKSIKLLEIIFVSFVVFCVRRSI